MPTPTVKCAEDSQTHRSGARSGELLLTGVAQELGNANALLPTPSAGNFNDGETPESWEARRLRNLAKGINGQGTPLGIAVKLLKTPTAQLAVNGGSQHPDKRKRGGHGPTLADEVEHLLPTPNATDPKGSSGLDRGRPVGDDDLPTRLERLELLPTPTADDAKATRNRTAGRSNPSSQHHDGMTLLDVFWTGESTDPQ
jgi:hypothetical protein